MLLLVVKVVVVCDVPRKGGLEQALLRFRFCSAVGRSLAAMEKGVIEQVEELIKAKPDPSTASKGVGNGKQ